MRKFFVFVYIRKNDSNFVDFEWFLFFVELLGVFVMVFSLLGFKFFIIRNVEGDFLIKFEIWGFLFVEKEFYVF